MPALLHTVLTFWFVLCSPGEADSGRHRRRRRGVGTARAPGSHPGIHLGFVPVRRRRRVHEHHLGGSSGCNGSVCTLWRWARNPMHAVTRRWRGHRQKAQVNVPRIFLNRCTVQLGYSCGVDPVRTATCLNSLMSCRYVCWLCVVSSAEEWQQSFRTRPAADKSHSLLMMLHNVTCLLVVLAAYRCQGSTCQEQWPASTHGASSCHQPLP